jgi:hypothetical protein
MTSVAGGQIATSAAGVRALRPAIIAFSSAAPDLNPFIFQLPATSGRGRCTIDLLDSVVFDPEAAYHAGSHATTQATLCGWRQTWHITETPC